MKTLLLALTLGVLCTASFAREFSHDDHQENGVRHFHQGNHVVIKMRRVAVPAPQHIINPQHVVRENRQIEVPHHDERGVAIVQRAAVAPPRHGEVTGHGQFLQRIDHERHDEQVHGRYYWHNDGDRRYCHFYDNVGVHWYGFYRGSEFYWTRWHANRWWWWDTRFTRWVFWYNGYWWWQDPEGAAFVYVDNNYYPYESVNGGVTVKSPEVQAPSATPPPTSLATSDDHSWKSTDGSREILTAAGGEAFLFDHSGEHPVFLKYIGRGVQKARFTAGSDGKPVRILVEFEDGTFAVFDANGQSQDIQPDTPGSADLPGAPPAVTPPNGSSTPPAPPAQP